MAYGLSTTGFSAPPDIPTLQTEIGAAFQAAFGASINLDPQSVFGQLAGILAEREYKLWAALLSVYASQDPDKATGSAQDAVAGITGAIRKAATYSEASTTLAGDVGAMVPQGSQWSVVGAGTKFATSSDATLVATPVTIGGTTYPGSALVTSQAVDAGPLVALMASSLQIETPVSGWNAVALAADAIPGATIETDAVLRLRREQELRTGANAAVEAIRSALLVLAHVRSAVVFENVTDSINGDSEPAHSVEAVVLTDGTDVAAAIRAAVFKAAAGIAIYGTSAGTVTDSQGIVHSVPYSPATQIDVYQSFNVTYDPTTAPADLADLLQASLLAYGNALTMGKDVWLPALYSRLYVADPGTLATDGSLDPRAGLPIPGIIDVSGVVGTSYPPGTGEVGVDLRSLAVFHSGDDGGGNPYLVINLFSGTP